MGHEGVAESHGIFADLILQRFSLPARLIVVPEDESVPSMSPRQRGLRLLAPHEAYWSVDASLRRDPCAQWELKRHYGGGSEQEISEMEFLFTHVLKVRQELTQEDVDDIIGQDPREFQDAVRSPVEGPSPARRVEEGLQLRRTEHTERPQVAAVGANSSATAASASAALPPGMHPSSAVSALMRARSQPPPAEGAERMGGPAQAAPASGRKSRHNAQSQLSAMPFDSAPLPRVWKRAGELGGSAGFPGFALFVTAGSKPVPDVGSLDSQLLQRVCMVFGLHPAQVAFGYDPTGRGVCEDRLLLDLLSIPKASRLPGPWNAVAFWCAELSQAVAHLATGRAVDQQLLRLQAEVLAVTVPLALQVEQQARASSAAAAMGHPLAMAAPYRSG